ncbi:hypothetical protein CUJ84_pRLN3000427 (plasmid) [Rhizobium leguminosarum]|uniref:Uncharacterized protein n=1 Tax=Rhizobium leguminosarum TaxID=384 RepID=A0A2K9ZH13_RHILE|nr:hypothetical protein CUJ84_pRLN3000427 [Rhizobium leguminosarum]
MTRTTGLKGFDASPRQLPGLRIEPPWIYALFCIERLFSLTNAYCFQPVDQTCAASKAADWHHARHNVISEITRLA